ncbi:hypothetical protein ACNKHM_20380 [Shigella sonnei]
MKRLMTASWPGNVRQLVNVIEQCVALTSSPVIHGMRWWSRRWRAKTRRCQPSEARDEFELNYFA